MRVETVYEISFNFNRLIEDMSVASLKVSDRAVEMTRLGEKKFDGCREV